MCPNQIEEGLFEVEVTLFSAEIQACFLLNLHLGIP